MDSNLLNMPLGSILNVDSSEQVEGTFEVAEEKVPHKKGIRELKDQEKKDSNESIGAEIRIY